MANYAAPSVLFPSSEAIALCSGQGKWSSFEQQIRESALKGYTNDDAPDKELSRFMSPLVPWDLSTVYDQPIPLRYCGAHSWIAAPEDAPFIPDEMPVLLTNLFTEPRSLLHLLGATFTRLRILYIADDLVQVDLPSDALMNGSRELVLVVVKPGIVVTINDTLTPDSLSARSIVGLVGSGAFVTIKGDHRGTAQAMTAQHDRWYLKKAAQLRYGEILTGVQQSWIRKEFIIHEQASLSYTWLAALIENEQAALTTVQEHVGKGSSSSILAKAVLSDRSRSFYRGTIRIAHQAEKSLADQQQRALMVSSRAQTCAIPSLEVATHEVQCQHGSAAGKFSAHELQFLVSRGLSVEQAQQLLIEGFFNEPFLDHTRLTHLKERVRF